MTERFDKKYELQENKIRVIQDRVETTEVNLKSLEEKMEQTSEEIITHNELQKTENNKVITSMKDQQNRDNIKTHRRITDLEETVKEGINFNMNIAEEENRKTELNLWIEIEKKIQESLNKNGNNTHTHAEEMERRFLEMKRELQTLSEPRVMGECGVPHISYIGKIEEFVKFCVDFRKIHSVKFIKAMKIRSKSINNADYQK